jgi:hypothetical protein
MRRRHWNRFAGHWFVPTRISSSLGAAMASNREIRARPGRMNRGGMTGALSADGNKPTQRTVVRLRRGGPLSAAPANAGGRNGYHLPEA